MTIPPAMTTISSPDGSSFAAYLARPSQTPAPAVIVIQEIFGITPGLRTKCDQLAQAGFMAIAPDLFWRLEPGLSLSDQKPDELQKAFDLFGRFNIDQGVTDLVTVLEWIRARPDSTGKVGCVGYCLGGKLAYLMASRSSIDASVGYYGVDIVSYLNEASSIKAPLMLHVAGADQFVPPDQQAAMHRALGSHSHVTLHDYPGMEHAFSRDGGAHYNQGAATLADQRTAAFLTKNLGL